MAQKRVEPGRGKATRVVSSRKGSKKGFYVGLAVAGVAGIAALSYLSSQSRKGTAIQLDANLPPVESHGYVLGSPTAPVELTEFGDFECPQCERFASITEPDVRAQYVNTGKVRLRFIDFPLSMHANTLNASVAAACADEQGKFWEMHDVLYANQHRWNGQATSNPDKVIKEIGHAIPGIDAAKLDECIDTRRTLPKVQSHLKLANDRQVNSTPTFVIGSQQLPPLIAFDDLRVYLDRALAAADSGAKKPAATSKKP